MERTRYPVQTDLVQTGLAHFKMAIKKARYRRVLQNTSVEVCGSGNAQYFFLQKRTLTKNAVHSPLRDGLHFFCQFYHPFYIYDESRKYCLYSHTKETTVLGLGHPMIPF